MISKRRKPTTNSSSMADIAFLLLVFFMLVTTIEDDYGQTIVMPPIGGSSIALEKPPFSIQINALEEVMINNSYVTETEARRLISQYLNTVIVEDGQIGFVDLVIDTAVSYKRFIEVNDWVHISYAKKKGEISQSLFKKEHDQLSPPEKRAVKEKLQLKFVEH